MFAPGSRWLWGVGLGCGHAMSALPACADNHNVPNYGKASLRFQQILQKHGLPHGHPEPRRIPPDDILPSPLNRLGRPLNLQYIHRDMIVNLGTDGFNPNRPTPGMVVRRTMPQRLERLHEHSKSMHKLSGALLPPLSISERDKQGVSRFEPFDNESSDVRL